MHDHLKFHITRHMAIRMAERKIPLEHAKNTVNYATDETRLQDGPHGGILKHFTKSDGKHKLTVIAEIKRNDCWLATVYYED